MPAATILDAPKKHYGKLKNYVDGEWVDSSASKSLDVVNPALDEVIAEVPLSTQEEVNTVANIAQEAFLDWRETPPTKRQQYFFTLKQLLEDHFEELSRIIVQEMGKTIQEARGEMRRTIEEVDCACGVPKLMHGYLAQDISFGIDLRAINEPLGVFCMIPAFNFPALVPMEYLPYALATGCTYIVKPSSEVPITQTRIFELIHEAGFPPGVVNMIHGSRDVVKALIDHPFVKGVSFVGSSPVGKLLYEQAARHGKRAQMAGGAKNHFVVMPDADLDKTVGAILSSFFGCSGQRCLAGSVLVPVGDVAEPLLEKLLAAASKMRMGYGMDENMQMGALVSSKHRDNVVGFIDKGVAEGAELLLDGRKAVPEDCPNAAFVGPTVFDRVKPEMSIAQEEIFGPVASVIRAADLDAALELIAANEFGHSAMIFTESGRTAREFEYRATCGNIGINIGVAATQAMATLGSIKESFYGDLHGRSESIQFFTDRKIVISRWT